MFGNDSGRDKDEATRRRFLSLTAAASGGVAVTGTAAAESGSSEVELCFPDQTTDGTSVTLEYATLSDDGFVVIHDAKALLAGNRFESVIGVSEYLGTGTHWGVTVNLYEGVPSNSFDRSRLVDGQMVVATPHVDTNSSEVYEYVVSEGDEDEPYTRDGRPVRNPATIGVDRDS